MVSAPVVNTDVEESLCLSYDRTWWFPTQALADYDTGMKAISICRRCPRRRSCHEDGQDAEYGIWGGEPHGIKFAVRRCVQCKTERPISDYAPRGENGQRAKKCVDCNPKHAIMVARYEKIMQGRRAKAAAAAGTVV